MSKRAAQRRAQRAGTNRACISWMYGDTVAGPFNNSVAKTFMDDAQLPVAEQRFTNGGGFISMSTGPLIVPARNNIVRQFLEAYTDAEWLVMIDADMCWGSGAVHQLLDAAEQHSFDVLGGLCFSAARQTGELYPTVYVVTGHQDKTDMPLLERVLDYPRDVITQCDATGAAFIAMRRPLLLAMFERYRYYNVDTAEGETLCANPHPWFAETYTNTGGYYGEDLTFCLRARSVGAKVGVHTGIKIGHVKPKIMAELEWDAQQDGDRPYTETSLPTV